MREILFKSKRDDNGEWVEGLYIHCDVSGKDFIFPKGSGVNESQLINEEGCLRIFCFEVIPETLCQYTGLTDRSGNKIWENDIVAVSGEDEKYQIEWDVERAAFVIESDTLQCDFDNYNGNELEIVGNVFDNSDLLEGENGDT